MSALFQTFFYQPVVNLLVFLYDIVPGHDLGLTIILLTIVIKLLLWPLSKQSIQSQKALQDIQPKVEAIKKKYSKDREAMGRAMMQLYKEHKVNPFSSCLPLLIQLPFLIAVFRVFRSGFTEETLGLVYSFIVNPDTINNIAFGFLDLSKPNAVLAIAAGAAQFWQTKMLQAKRPEVKSPGARDENVMAIMNKQMMYLMPALTVFIGLTFPGGLALYWLTTTLLTALQQLWMFKKQNKEDGQTGAIKGEVAK